MAKTYLYKDKALQSFSGYPGLKHFFKMEEVNGSVSLTDAKNGVVVTNPNQVITRSAGTIAWPGQSNTSFDKTNNTTKPVIPGTRTIVTMFCGYEYGLSPNQASEMIWVGNLTGVGNYGFSASASFGAAGNADIRHNTTTLATTAGSCAADSALSSLRGVKITPGQADTNGFFCFDVKGEDAAGVPIATTYTKRTPGVSMATIPSMTDMSPFWGFISCSSSGGGAAELAYGQLQVWYFDVAPSDNDLKLAALWTWEAFTARTFVNNNSTDPTEGIYKALWPGFAGRASTGA